MDTNQVHGQAIIGNNPSAIEGGLIERVRMAGTVESGLAILRQGIGDQLASTFGSSLDAYAQSSEPLPGDQAPGSDQGGTPAKIQMNEEVATKLNQLYVSLTTENEQWAKALIANTPLAPSVEQLEQQTTSQAAMA